MRTWIDRPHQKATTRETSVGEESAGRVQRGEVGCAVEEQCLESVSPPGGSGTVGPHLPAFEAVPQRAGLTKLVSTETCRVQGLSCH